MGNILSGLLGAGLGLLTGGPAGAIAGGITGFEGSGSPSGLPNISSSTDPLLPAQQGLDYWYEASSFGMEAEEMRHQLAMQQQSQAFNDVEDEQAEQMRELNTLRDVAMKQREADDKIVKEFIKTAGGD